MSEAAHEAAFVDVADQINEAVREAVGKIMLAYRGPLLPAHVAIAAMSGMVAATGYLCAHFEPDVDASAFRDVMPGQFDEGRSAYREGLN